MLSAELHSSQPMVLISVQKVISFLFNVNSNSIVPTGTDLTALSKIPSGKIFRDPNEKFQYPIVRQPSLVNMCNSTLHYGRHRFNYFILMSLLIALGSVAIIV